jgi:hypothetical protein
MNRNLASLAVLTKDNPRIRTGSFTENKTSEKAILIRKLIDDRNQNLLKKTEKITILKKWKDYH